MQKFNITFSNQQLAILNDALIEMPYKQVAPLIAHINSEIQRCFDEQLDIDKQIEN